MKSPMNWISDKNNYEKMSGKIPDIFFNKHIENTTGRLHKVDKAGFLSDI